MIHVYNRAVAERKEAKNREASRKEEAEEGGEEAKQDDEEGELCSMLTLLAFGATKC